MARATAAAVKIAAAVSSTRARLRSVLAFPTAMCHPCPVARGGGGGSATAASGVGEGRSTAYKAAGPDDDCDLPVRDQVVRGCRGPGLQGSRTA